MDSIDITDSAFSLNTPSIIGGSASDTTIYLYIGAVILIALFGFFTYKFYQTKRINSTLEPDCEGGFCTMEGYPRQL